MSPKYLKVLFSFIQPLDHRVSAKCYYHYNSTIKRFNKTPACRAWEKSFQNLFQCSLLDYPITFICDTFHYSDTELMHITIYIFFNVGKSLMVTFIKGLECFTEPHLRESLEQYFGTF